MQKPEAFTIKRSLWFNGNTIEPYIEGSKLLRESDSKMCCLGHFGLACGATKAEILGISVPANTNLKWPILAVYYNTFIFINDNKFTPQEYKEAELQKLFALDGITVTFVD